MCAAVAEPVVSKPVVAIKPPRLNFARRCIYCLGRDCDSPHCKAMYERSRWGVCPDCDGREGDEITSESCDSCVFGVVELPPMSLGAPIEPL
jgi:hypothetical protein